MTARDNDKLVRNFLRAWERRDTDYITMNGVEVTLPICGTFEVDGGRITAWREYFDLGPVRAAYES